MVTACVRSLAPSLPTIFLMWKLTVVSEIASSSAISLLRCPYRISRTMSTELGNGFATIHRLGDQQHIRLRAYDRSDPFAKDRMVLDAQDANRLGGIDTHVLLALLLRT